jgi:deoxycytidine triphosphate deaminase
MSLIGRDELERRIFDASQPETILLRQWASESCLRAAGYDLRIAADRLTVNGAQIGPTQEVILKPGDVATVATHERFCMPWDLAANIGVRFHFARRGLLVFTGLLVDPGFGLESDGKDGWQPKADERLEFFIANLGATPLEIRLGDGGDRVLSLQFFSVDEPTQKRLVTAPETGLSTQALSVFRDVRGLERRLAKETNDRKSDSRRFDILLQGVRSATDQIVVFGVFLLAVTVIGVTLATLLQGLASDNAAKIVKNLNDLDVSGTGPILICVAFLLLATVVTIGTVFAVVKSFAVLWQTRIGRPSWADVTPDDDSPRPPTR